MFSSQIIYTILAAGLVGGAYFYYFHWRKKGETPDQVEQKEKPAEGENLFVPVAIADDSDIPSRLIYQDMKYSEVRKIIEAAGNVGRVWSRDGKRLYPLHKDKDGTLGLLPQAPVAPTPRELFDDMQMPEMELIYDMREDKPFLEQYGMVLWWVAVMAFIMFLWVSG